MASENPSPATTAQPSAVEPSAAPTEQPSNTPSSEPSVQPPASSVAPTTPPASSAAPSSEASSAPPQSSAPPPSSQAPPSSSAQPTSQPPSSSSSPAPSSQQSSQEPSSQAESSQSSAAPSSTSSAAPTSAASSSSSASASVSQLTSAIDLTTTDSQGHVVTTKPSLITQTATSTDGSGKVWTVTQVVANPTGLNDSSSSKGSSSSFFDNTGAVAGTFVVVGLAVTAGILAFVFFMLKRRRRQRLDRDVAAAAAAAAAAAHHSRRDMDDFDDDEKTNPAITQYGGYYAGTDIHGEPEQHMGQYDYEDPAGGYDHYAANLPAPGDRMSTATAPGLAGFGAQAAQATYGQQNGMYAHPEAYEDLAEEQQHSYPPHPQGGYNALSRDSVPSGNQPGGGYYFDPKDAGQFDYSEEDVYAYNEQAAQDHPVRPPHQRTGSEGSVARVGDAERGLKITNA